MVKMSIEAVTPIDTYNGKGNTNRVYFEQVV
jgi:hypothetical protein